MTDLSIANDAIYIQRIFIMILISLTLLTITGIIIGPEKKALWFKKRSKYTLFTRRSILSEFIHFGHPCTREGFLITFFFFVVVFGFGYWFVFCY